MRAVRSKWLAVLFAAATAVAACSRAERSAPGPAMAPGRATDAGSPFDVETMAFLSKARALHHEANVREDAGDARGAIAAVDRIVRASLPHPGTNVPEVEEVLADAWARLAELDVRVGDLTAAENAAKEGLTHARAPTYFRGHLLEVQGIAEEARSLSLADAGNAAGAAAARAAAMRLLEEAVAIQDQVIEGALGADASANEGGRP